MARYQVTMQASQGAMAYHLLDLQRHAEAVLYPDFGFNCTEFRTTPDGSDANALPIDVFVPPAHVKDLQVSPFHAGQPILFPFPNRVRGGGYTFEGETYEMKDLLEKGWDKGAGQAIHGLVADKVWTVEAANADDDSATIRASLQLDDDASIFRQYPFPCRITITYTLRDGVLAMRTEVLNTGRQTLPMGFGIHPWFPTALRPGALANTTMQERAKAEVHVPANALWELVHLMPTGNVLPLSSLPRQFDLRLFRPLEDHFYDHVFTGVIRWDDGWSGGGLRDPASGVEMYLEADDHFREWVLYAPETRPVIALEPYTCVTDAVNLQPQGVDAGLIALPAGETWQGDIRFGLRHS